MDERSENELLLPFEDVASSRRGFLRLVGFGLGSAGISACARGPERFAIPALDASPEFVPGRAYWIASTCGGCEAGCGVLAKCRDGRPIKLEGTPGHPVSGGGLCPAGQGSVLSLYDSLRFTAPLWDGEEASWSDVDRRLAETFDRARSDGGRVRLLTGTINSPSTRAQIARFLEGFADARHVTYDGLSASAILEAHEQTHGARVLPRYRFDRAQTIVAFDADFLSTWISPVEFTAAYTAGRDLEAGKMSRHFQLEARTSLTGCRADVRARVAPWDVAPALRGLCEQLEGFAGIERRFEGASRALAGAAHAELVERMARELWESRGESLVVAGANDLEVQLLVNYANHLLDAYGATLDIERASLQRMGDDRDLDELRRELEGDQVDVLICHGVNPAYDLGAALPVERAALLVACDGAPNETTQRATCVCPEAHFLESWNDAEPFEGTYVLSQPTVPRLRGGRTLRETLARWSGDERDDSELLREHWRSDVLVTGDDSASFESRFDRALHDGSLVLEARGGRETAFRSAAIEAASATARPVAGALGLVLYAKAGALDGRHAHNPWLHELPDPVSKITWDNYACLSPSAAERLGLDEGDLVSVTATDGDAAIELPVHVQLGQHDDVVAVALGYGRAGTDRFTGVGPEWVEGRPTVRAGEVVGVNAAGLVALVNGARRFAGREVRVESIGGSVELAATQDHHSLTLPEHLALEGHEVRDMVRTTSFDEWQADPGAATHGAHVAAAELWEDDHVGERSWGLVIDLARCTGCSACVVGCQAENNVPVVGRDEVARHREMSWLRIDRYFQGGDDDLRTHHQPMMCQQCDHAPCESVCPVLATVHSAEGLNQQVYNRCVGTRYCANTCPYKVRRFNWFDYPREDQLENHSLNPDVTVRSRGVMEKCSFCVQRIQEAKAEAKREGRELRDGDVQPACQQSCPASAIVFGDRHDPESRVSKLGAAPRGYGVLEELNVRPSIKYLAHVHNGARAGSTEVGHDG